MNRYLAVERRLRTAAPHELLDAVRAALIDNYGVTAVELLMADYALTTLQPVSVLPYTSRPYPVHTTDQGTAFLEQRALLIADPHRDSVTQHLPITVRGDRIGVLSIDAPAHLEAAALVDFEQIAELLGHEILVAERDTDVYLQARRADRLTLAAEMQWQLLPGRACTRPEYSLGAQLEPAYAIYGDNFDWSASAEHFTLTMSNGMGEGIDAALLTNLTVNALRNARRAGVPLAEQAMLADQALYGHYAGAQHVSALLLRFALDTGVAEVVDAGSPRMWLLRNGTADTVTFDDQLPLGMFEDTQYSAETFCAEPGDRMIFVSDGVYDVASPGGERYGERALARAIVATRSAPAARIPRALLHELLGHRSTPHPDDDAMIVCLDWHGPAS